MKKRYKAPKWFVETWANEITSKREESFKLMGVSLHYAQTAKNSELDRLFNSLNRGDKEEYRRLKKQCDIVKDYLFSRFTYENIDNKIITSAEVVDYRPDEQILLVQYDTVKQMTSMIQKMFEKFGKVVDIKVDRVKKI